MVIFYNLWMDKKKKKLNLTFIIITATIQSTKMEERVVPYPFLATKWELMWVP